MTCEKCHKIKKETEFRKKSNSKFRYNICIQCKKEEKNEITLKRNNRKKTNRIRHIYKVDHIVINKLLKEQDYKCAICSKSFHQHKYVIDHDHNTGLVRGLLCYSCNTGLGKLGDTIKGLKRAIAYLKK